MAAPVVRTRIAVLASCDVLSSGSQPSANAMPPGEVDLVLDGDVVSLAVGYGHALVAVSEGQVFSWGRNDSFGKLGIGEDSPIVLQHKPRQVLGDIVGRKIVQVAAGSHHCLALDEDGAVYGWGMDIYGQTGVTSMDARNVPRRLTAVPRGVQFKEISAGWNHSALIDTAGRLYTMGCGKDGQLGYGCGEARCVASHVSEITSKVKHVRCGYAHTVALTESNEVYSFGNDGLKRTFISYFMVPRPIDALRGVNVVQVATGSCYTLFLDALGTVFASGNNEVGQLGLGDTERRVTPVVVTSLLDHFVVKVCAFLRYSVAFTREGLVFQWGDGRLVPSVRVSNIGPSIDGEVGNGILVAKARVIDSLQKQVDGQRENVFNTPGSIGRDLLMLRKDPFLLSMADVDVISNGARFKAHSFVLASRCKRLSCEPGRDKELHLSAARTASVEALLMFIYSNVLPHSLTVEEAGEVLNLANELELKGSLATLQEVLPKELVKPTIHVEKDAECSICLQVMTDSNATELDCGHLFHPSCVDQWFKVKSTCPICKAHVETRHLWTMFVDDESSPMAEIPAWLRCDNVLDNFLGVDLTGSLEVDEGPDLIIGQRHGDEGATVRAHKAVLAARSSTLRMMLEAEMDSHTLYVDRISGHFLNAIVRFMYEGNAAVLFLLDKWGKELLVTAEEFGIPDLKQLCERFLLHNLRVRDVAILLQTASRANAHRLRMGCLSVLDHKVRELRRVLEATEQALTEEVSTRKKRIFRRNSDSVGELTKRLSTLKKSLTCEVFQLGDQEAVRLVALVQNCRLEHMLESHLDNGNLRVLQRSLSSR